MKFRVRIEPNQRAIARMHVHTHAHVILLMCMKAVSATASFMLIWYTIKTRKSTLFGRVSFRASFSSNKINKFEVGLSYARRHIRTE